MKCPYCAIAFSFQQDDTTMIHRIDEEYGFYNSPNIPSYDIVLGFCPECYMPIVLLRTGSENSLANDEPSTSEILYPRHSSRPVDESVTEKYVKDFQEAVSILDLSPKASAAISRRLLQHILRDELKVKHSKLSKEIEEFVARPNIPGPLSEQVDEIRNIGNLASHPIKNSNTGEIIDVEPGEAEWLLDVIEELFDFVFVKPKKIRD